MINIMAPDDIVEKGNDIYQNTFRDEYESIHDGKFLATDVANENAYLSDFPEEALAEAEKRNPNGSFYLVKIGAETAFHVGYIGEQDNDLDWSFRQTA